MDLVICSLIQFTQENEKSEPFSYRKKVRIFLVWWASQDLNPGPSGYEKVHCAEMLFFLCNNYKLHVVLLTILHII